MLKKIYKICFVSAITTLPLLSFAVEGIGTGAPLLGTARIFDKALFIVNQVLIPLAFSLALLLFFWGVAKYIWGEGQGKDDGKKLMIWGIVALFVMSSVWGLVFFIRDELGIGNNTNSPIPTIGDTQ